jgi:hypothetical protein
MRVLLLTLPLILGCPPEPKPDDTGVLEYADADGDGYDEVSDCDDGDASVHPGADEVCNGVDDDCDGFVDDDDPGSEDGELWYPDLDDDGYGDPSGGESACEPPDGWVADASDCDDADASVHPGADEACNGVDDDCDGDIDEGSADLATFWADADGDGYGDADVAIEACAVPDGYVADATDCDDGDASVHPDAIEQCNERDDDCDGDIDEGIPDTATWYTDMDGDGYGDPDAGIEACAQPSGTVAEGTDCDDTDSEISPIATERCDGIDNDCDSLVDDDDDSVAGTTTWYADADGDGYGLATDAVVACTQPSGTVADATDCDDGDATVNPGATELCNGVDDDCDGTVDVGAADASTWYTDADVDGYGDAGASTVACDQPSGTVADNTDCDDAAASTYPGADEYCNGVDDDCNGAVDDSAVDQSTWYADADLDGYGDATASTIACYAPSGMVADNTDCDDTDVLLYPGATEACNGIDDDCDGAIDEGAPGSATWYNDIDGDGYGDDATAVVSCVSVTGWVTTGGDCDDGDAAVNPLATEYCDGVDTDCDGDLDPSDTVTFVASGGAMTDVSSSFQASSSGSPGSYGLSSDGQLNLCAGSYSALIDVSAASAAILGLEGSALTELSGGLSGRLITVDTGAAQLTVSGLTLSEGAASTGGAISSAIAGLDFVAEDLDIYWSVATGYGGAIYLLDANSASLTSVSFTECGGVRGGGLYMEEGTIALEDLSFDLNVATERGGGFMLKNVDGSATELLVTDNISTDDGGGFYIEGTTLELSDSVVSGNSAVDKGGGIYLKNQHTLLELLSSLVQANLADSGAGMYVDDSDATCTGSSGSSEGFLSNLATSGGGLYVKGGHSSFAAVSCDLGTGSEDNILDDIYVHKGGLSYSSYGDDVDFDCDEDSCW